MDETLMQREFDLEMEMRSFGTQQFRDRIAKARERHEEGTTPYGLVLTREGIEPLAQALVAFVEASYSGKAGRRHTAAKYLKGLDPNVVAFLTLRVVMNSVSSYSHRQGATAAATGLGSRIEDEIRFQAFANANPELFRKVQQSVAKSRHAGYKAAVLNHSMEKYEIKAAADWSTRTRLLVGLKCIELLVETTGLVELETMVDVARKRQKMYIRATPKTMEWIDKRIMNLEVLTPAFLPTLVPPRPWEGPRTGGYHFIGEILSTPFVRGRGGQYGNLSAKWEQMPLVVEAVNVVSSTGWKVNRPVLEVAREIWERGQEVGALAARHERELPRCPKCGSSEVGNRSDPHLCFSDLDLLSEWKRDTARVYDANVRVRSKRIQAATTLATAERFKEEPVFHYPHQLDFRGRMYPMPWALQPQGDDLAKGLLLLAEGLPIDTGEQAGWLMIHGANCFGYDKVSLEDRIDWAHEYCQQIILSATYPHEHRWWQEASKPWQFLAFCYEYKALIAHGWGYVSHLPVSVDGSCNGLQHFAAILRDPGSAAAVNLAPAEKPADIYQQVADKVNAQLRLDLSTGDFDAQRYAQGWLGLGVDRGICKRPVMVVPYSGTIHSCRQYVYQYLMEEHGEHLPWPSKDIFPATQFLTNRIWAAIEETVGAAKEVMAWLRKVARITAKEGKELTWTSPLGFPVRQAYPAMHSVRIKTHIGESIFMPRLKEEKIGVLDVNDQVNGISPNFVHSLDAAALQLSVIRAYDMGIRNFSMIHDAYGVLAADMPVFSQCLRDAFVEIYEENDVLHQFRDHVMQETGLALPLPPERGDFDISLVRQSDFFFA